MTLDHALRLLAMLTDTVDAQQQQIDGLIAELQRRDQAVLDPTTTETESC